MWESWVNRSPRQGSRTLELPKQLDLKVGCKPDNSGHLEKPTRNLTPQPYKGWGRIQSLSPFRGEVWREVFQIP